MKTTELKSLEDHNRERIEFTKRRDAYPKPNGIACPVCGGELNDLDSSYLASYPPQRNIGCPECKYRGYRIA